MKLIYNISINQGATFDGLFFLVNGNYTTWTPRGQIRTDYAGKGGQLKATFSFAPLQIGQITVTENQIVSGTIIKPMLTSEQTKLLSLPSKNENWVYDIELQSPDAKVIRIVQGRVEVSAEVTV